jgi:light-regulated signal transduction histidine kinase (bacteriophytochrome)
VTTPPKVDLTNCDVEPIHIPGSIQPHGVMLVCSPERLIEFVSANAEEIIGVAPGDAVGMSLVEILGEQVAHDLANAAARSGGSEIAGLLLGVTLPRSNRQVDASIHRHRDRIFVELEPALDHGQSAQSALDLTQTLIRRIGLESSIEGIASAGAKLVRAMLGYDRVMVYQFLHNGAGRVIAEAKSPKLNSFLGQHFPASDIPFQARRLYLLNSIRMIGDSGYTPVSLTPSLAPGQSPVDMSFAQLRSVSPIHCEYLQNMGVSASMSLSIIVDGELWGLISCHHDSPKVVPIPLRIGAELFGQYYSLQIAVAERRSEILAAGLAREKLNNIVTAMDPDLPVADALIGHLSALASLVPTSGAGLWVDGRWNAVGNAPPMAAVDALVAHAKDVAPGTIWRTQELEPHLPKHIQAGDIAGVMAIQISSAPRDYLVLFRKEEAHEVEWAGEPVKRVVTSPMGDRLTPRGSFETWREDVRGRSEPWTDAEVAVAGAIRTFLRDVVLRYSEATADERTRAEQRRRILNDELNHRVKNIIALVKSIALQTGAHAATVEEYSASLEGRLRALAFAHDQSLSASGGSGDLAQLIEAEASLHRFGAPDRVVADGPSVGLDDRTFGVFALVAHEMMTNAAKYGALSTSAGRLAIAWRIDEAGDCVVTWSESGGPAVTAPTRTGFGSKLIQSTIAYDLGGAAEISYARQGLKARFVIPAQHLRDVVEAPKGAAETERGANLLQGLNVLLVEDQALIAMDTEDVLRKLGAAKVQSSPDVKQAQQLLSADLPDYAVLDFNLGNGTSEAIADVLVDRRIPFVFATGYGDSVMIPDRFGGIPVVRKPVSGPVLADRLATARRAIFAGVEERGPPG